MTCAETAPMKAVIYKTFSATPVTYTATLMQEAISTYCVSVNAKVDAF